MKVAVVTPTIGANTFGHCLQSVQNQTYPDLIHYVFIDGEEHHEKVIPILFASQKKHPKKLVVLEENVGKGWYGHRVYSACSFLVNADIICYLDEDNWYDSNHVQSLVDTIQSKQLDWAFSLRKIYDKNGEYICQDNCESLGKWPVYFNDQVFHIDTSSFAVKRDVAVTVGHAWYGQWGADRQFFGALKHFYPKFDCSGKYSLCYRLDGNTNSVPKEFFFEGNIANKHKYHDNFPWCQNV